jgi:hypothetical protein
VAGGAPGAASVDVAAGYSTRSFFAATVPRAMRTMSSSSFFMGRA